MAEHSTALTEPGPGGVCRVCEHRLQPGSLECSHCGAVYGVQNRCPSCRAIAGIDSGTGIGRCRVCGTLRFILSDPSVVRTGREVPLLRRAERARRAAVLRVALGAIAGAAAFAALTATLLLVGLGEPGGLVAALGFVVAALALLTGASLAGSARRAERERSLAVERARTLVASDIVASRGAAIDARGLGELLNLDEAAAELLLAEIQVNDFVHARVTETGELGAVPARIDARALPEASLAEIEDRDTASLRSPSPRGPSR